LLMQIRSAIREVWSTPSNRRVRQDYRPDIPKC